MNRREFVGVTALASLAAFYPRLALAAEQGAAAGGFSHQTVISLAEDLASRAFAPLPAVPEPVQKLTYDQYRDIRFKQGAGLWSGEGRGFTLDLLHTGFVYKSGIDVNIVENGVSRPIPYAAQMFDFGPLVPSLPDAAGTLFSGIRLRAPINTASYWDEFAVFQGASYFRAIGEGQNYGLSARGLTIDTAEPKGEEFPAFRSYWVEQPALGAKTVVVHALLDSKSVTGAYRFVVYPGKSTRMDVDVTLFVRRDMKTLGFAPLTSMFLFDESNRARFDDFRPAVHDSDGLAIRRGNGEWIWRHLSNPSNLQISAFMDTDPSGFGLMQRAERFEDFQDLEARYELRPSVWVEPKGNWGQGQVVLVEIPSNLETNDNIVAFWRPANAVGKGARLDFGYWLHWGPAMLERNLATVAATRCGLSFDHKRRLFVIDFAPPRFGENLLDKSAVEASVSASRGKVVNIVGRYSRPTGRYRVSFEMMPEGAELSELRVVLTGVQQKPMSETWLYRWTV
ncbi:MAG: glucan biosynthesis protein [Pseudomonadota bacterium]|nr:glucan biosynthesis protein [Pseudomonadota bacterium]